MKTCITSCIQTPVTVLRKAILKILNQSKTSKNSWKNACVEFGNGTSKVRNSEDIPGERNANGNQAVPLENKLKGSFVSKNVVNLSKRNLTYAEISLLSKGLNFVPTCNNIDKAKLKMELEAFGRMLRLK